MNPEQLKEFAKVAYKALEPRRQMVKAMKECTMPLEEIYDRAMEEAEYWFERFKSDLDTQLQRYPLNKIEILRESANKLRKAKPYSAWLGDGIENRDEILGFLLPYYGQSDDGYTIYKQIIETFDSKWSHEYLELLTNNELNSDVVKNYKSRRSITHVEDLFKFHVGERYAWNKYFEANAIRVDELNKQLPEPKTFAEAWEQFINYHAQMTFELMAEDFLRKYGAISVGPLESELNELYEFMEKAKTTVRTSKAFANANALYGPKPDFTSWEEEYIRLANGYYNDSRYEGLAHTPTPNVYGKYFMFKDWLEMQLDTLQDKVAIKPDTRYTTQEQEPKTENSKSYLEPERLVMLYTKFNGELWESVSVGEFLSVFTYASKHTLTIKNGKRELVCGLLKRMYDYSERDQYMKDWVKPLLEKLHLKKSTFDGIDSKLFNNEQKSRAQKTFLQDLKSILPTKANPTY
ncbi:hypothetical protein [Pontibacter sp. HSC-36F09]|uniref:hypothetical protein n=1 Tax=Pontibacter sp. HSC-36F09 TaxID=2910966 RepID=UPI00209C835B|nr:hypothetical protein [Pontibacter sp. HSC-36F09]MCP2043486.1 hypothetical protein [Pontibacter sp. HSC-36F09]